MNRLSWCVKGGGIKTQDHLSENKMIYVEKKNIVTK